VVAFGYDREAGLNGGFHRNPGRFTARWRVPGLRGVANRERLHRKGRRGSVPANYGEKLPDLQRCRNDPGTSRPWTCLAGIARLGKTAVLAVIRGRVQTPTPCARCTVAFFGIFCPTLVKVRSIHLVTPVKSPDFTGIPHKRGQKSLILRLSRNPPGTPRLRPRLAEIARLG
jgi:hypothetical protein